MRSLWQYLKFTVMLVAAVVALVVAAVAGHGMSDWVVG